MQKTNQRVFVTILIIIIVSFLILGFILPFTYDRQNRPVVQEPPWDSPQTFRLAERACFDCHSNETVWPWYSYLFPMATLIQRDVDRGRAVLNFSEWDASRFSKAKTETTVEVVSKNQMPLPYYILLHPEAELTNAEKGQLINGLIRTMSQDKNLEADELDQPEK